MRNKQLSRVALGVGAMLLSGYFYLTKPESGLREGGVTTSSLIFSPEDFFEDRPLSAILPLELIPRAEERTAVALPTLEEIGSATPNEDDQTEQYDYSQPRIQHFYELFTGERNRDIQTRIERTRRYDGLIRAAAERHDLPYETLFALIVHETGGNPDAISSAGARGLTQIMPRTADGRSCGNLANPEASIDCGAAYLAELRDRFGDMDLALAAYAIGPATLQERIRRTGTNNYWEIFLEGNYVPGIRATELVLFRQ